MTGTERLSRGSVLSAVALFGLVAACGAAARAETFVEDFSSLAYRDVLHTTAWWDTERGELRLPPYAMEYVGSLDVPEETGIRDMEIAGAYAYCAAEAGGLFIADISDVQSPFWLPGLAGVNSAMALDLEGDFVYLAASDRFVVVDVHDPHKPRLSGQVTGINWVADIAVAGDVAYVAAGNSGLVCVAVGEPELPAVTGSVDLPGTAQSLALYGDFAYVCTGYMGIAVVDISDPAQPVHVTQLPASYHPERIRISGNLAYVAEISSEILVYSLVDPAAPVLVGSCRLPGHAQDIAVEGRHGYVAVADNDHRGFYQLDLSDPTSPRIVSGMVPPGFPVGVELHGEYAFLNCFFDGFRVLRIADREPLAVAAELTGLSSIWGFALDGRVGFVTGFQPLGYVFRSISLVDPLQPEALGSCGLSSHPLGLALAPPLAYVASYGHGLDVVDISDPAQPQVVGMANLLRTGVSVEVCGDRLFLGYVDASAGIMTLDVSDPVNPVPVGDLPLYYSPHAMCRDGDYLFVTQYDDGELCQGRGKAAGDAPSGARQGFDVFIIDARDPLNLTVADTFIVEEAYVTRLHAEGNLLYAGFWTFQGMWGNGVLIYDITDPLEPVLLSRYDAAEDFGAMTLAGSLLFLAGGPRIDVLDVSDPAQPVVLQSLTTAQENRFLARAGDFLFALGNYGGLRSVRVFDREVDVSANAAQSLTLPAADVPLRRVRMETTASPTVTWQFSADGGLHWQALFPTAQWLSVLHPGDAPRWRATLLRSQPGAPPVVDELRLEWGSDPTAVDEPPALRFSLHPPGPNPFNPTTKLRFDLPRTCWARVEIFDAAGRRVRCLVDTMLPAGSHETAWDGLGAGGEALGSGTYCCRLQAAGLTETRKLTLAR